jgi:hypothetical protein
MHDYGNHPSGFFLQAGVQITNPNTLVSADLVTTDLCLLDAPLVSDTYSVCCVWLDA